MNIGLNKDKINLFNKSSKYIKINIISDNNEFIFIDDELNTIIVIKSFKDFFGFRVNYETKKFSFKYKNKLYDRNDLIKNLNKTITIIQNNSHNINLIHDLSLLITLIS